jgi:hypothetical protein
VKQTHTTGERFIHRDLWAVVRRQREHTQSDPRGAFHNDLVAMVFGFHTLEAYLNFLGERLDPNTWADERNFFRREPYRGFDGKLKKVLELAGMASPNFDARPYSAIASLKRLRDTIAHGKLESFSTTIVHPADEEPEPHMSELHVLVTKAQATQALADIEQFIEELHACAKNRLPDVWAAEEALRGPLQWSVRRTTRAV